MASRAARLDALCDAADRIPGLLEVLERTVERARAGHKDYKRLHWRDPGDRGLGEASVPDVKDGVVVLGGLVEVVYVTKKGRSCAEWQHAFDAPLPILGVAPDGKRSGLVVARTDSRYTVNERGIVG